MKKTSTIAVIGGSGVYDLDIINVIKEHSIETPFGSPSGKIVEAEIEGNKCFFLPRHGKGHFLTPSEVNYRANIYALKTLNVDTVVSVSAVGSLKDEAAPTHIVLPSQFVDWTKGLRERTFFGEGVVGHVSTAYPVEKGLRKRIASICSSEKLQYVDGGSYLCIEGPQFSSRAESEIYRSFQATVIGMTNVPEAYLAKEAGMAYATIAMVTDYDCWKEEHCSVDEIMKIMKKNYESAQKILVKLIPSLMNNPIEFNPENQFAVVTNPELISDSKKKMLEVILS